MKNLLLVGDVRETLKQIADKSIHCCVTSPPYWGLRDYGNDGQLGLEPTPTEYVDELVKVFKEIHRVLRDDGTLWLNIGDSYASFRDGKVTPDTTRGESNGTFVEKGKASNRMASSFVGTSIKHKDLVGIPWRLAFALQADGWYLRQDIIWAKPNPMPE
jgi:DNA modification methylase